MARGAPTFRKRDLTVAIQAVTAAGVDIARVEVHKEGRIVLVTAKGDGSVARPNDLDQELVEFIKARDGQS